MKRLPGLAVIAAVSLAAGEGMPVDVSVVEEGRSSLTLAERGKTPAYVIVLPENPAPSQVTAAKTLAGCVAKMTSVRLPIETNTAPHRAIFLGEDPGIWATTAFACARRRRISGSRAAASTARSSASSTFSSAIAAAAGSRRRQR